MENKDLTITTNEGKEIFVIDSREVAEMMGKTHSKLLRDIEGDKSHVGIISILEQVGDLQVTDYFIQSNYKDVSNKTNKCYLCTMQGVKFILDKTSNYKKKEKLYNWYYKKTNQEIAPILADRHEIQFLDILEESLKAFNITGIRQYNTLKYRIDYYIPSLNIAIEYDENGHEYYSYEEHECRQKEIENELGCRFIRVTDNDTHYFNIGKVIKEIFNI